MRQADEKSLVSRLSLKSIPSTSIVSEQIIPDPPPAASLSKDLTITDAIRLNDKQTFSRLLNQEVENQSVSLKVYCKNKLYLHWAAYYNSLSIIDCLLENEFDWDVNEQERNSLSGPLHWAIQNNHYESTKALLQTGRCNLLIADKNGINPTFEIVSSFAFACCRTCL